MAEETKVTEQQETETKVEQKDEQQKETPEEKTKEAVDVEKVKSDAVAEYLQSLGYGEEELEHRGWVKVFNEYDSDKAVYAQHEANERQLEWLRNHQVYYSKYACMQ